MPKLTIQRRGGYTGIFRRYDIEVDGQMLGKVGHKETASVDVTEGRHKVRIRVDWCGSEAVDVDVGPEGAALACEDNPHLPWLGIVYIFLPNRWFVLRRIDDGKASG